MSDVRLPPRAAIENCPGQQCPEREACARYVRPAVWPHTNREGEKLRQAWASFDIERQHLGTCVAKEPIKESRVVARHG